MSDPLPTGGPASTADGGAPLRPAVYLHIGTLKTGTSFLQSVLLRNAAKLRRVGVLYPIDDTRWAFQVRAVRDVLGRKGTEPVHGDWERLVAAMRDWPGRASVVSMEFLSLASEAQVERILRSLDGFEVHVVLTLRDLARLLPSAWQSMVKQGRPWPFGEFVAGVTADDPMDNEPGRRFWHHHDAQAIAERWLAGVAPENVHIVTVPPPGSAPELLWQRFCAVVGLDGDDYDTSQGQKSNFSLSYSDTELLRQVNVELATLSKRDHKRWATRFLANRVLRADSSDAVAADRLEVDGPTRAWAIERSRPIVEGLRGLGVHVVGDLDELLPDPSSGAEPQVDPAHPYPERASYVIATMVRKLVELDAKAAEVASERRSGRDRPSGRRERGTAATGFAADDLDDDFFDQPFDEDGPGEDGTRRRSA